MKMPINTSGVALAAVAAVLFNVVSVSTAGATEAKVQCDGVNACKGQSACKTANNGCKGQNSCKGKGGCKSSDNGCAGKNSCKGKGGCAAKK